MPSRSLVAPSGSHLEIPVAIRPELFPHSGGTAQDSHLTSLGRPCVKRRHDHRPMSLATLSQAEGDQTGKQRELAEAPRELPSR